MELGKLWAGSTGQGSRADYQVLAGDSGVFVARSRSGEPALLVQVDRVPAYALGRQTAGFDLRPYGSLSFRHAGRSWKSPAAALLCRDPEGIEAFAVLASDVESRLQHTPREWANVLSIVEEWQNLLARKPGQSAEWELGLWGELWLLSQTDHVDEMLAGWRGPEREGTDFLIGGRAVEVKTSRKCGCHWISAAQVELPVGDAEAYLLSMWVGVDPIVGETLPDLVATVLRQSSDPATAMRRMAVSGYSPGDRTAYQSRFVHLAEPQWYRIVDVPRVRVTDAGVSHIRYLATLDEDQRIQATSSLWHHFLGHEYGRAQ